MKRNSCRSLNWQAMNWRRFLTRNRKLNWLWNALERDLWSLKMLIKDQEKLKNGEDIEEGKVIQPYSLVRIHHSSVRDFAMPLQRLQHTSLTKSEIQNWNWRENSQTVEGTPGISWPTWDSEIPEYYSQEVVPMMSAQEARIRPCWLWFNVSSCWQQPLL